MTLAEELDEMEASAIETVQRHLDAMKAAADVGYFEIAERIRRDFNLKVCCICRGESLSEQGYCVLWRDTILNICVACEENTMFKYPRTSNPTDVVVRVYYDQTWWSP